MTALDSEISANQGNELYIIETLPASLQRLDPDLLGSTNRALMESTEPQAVTTSVRSRIPDAAEQRNTVSDAPAGKLHRKG